MRTLYHFALSPFSRKVRIVLGEKKLAFELVNEKFWQRRKAFLAMNPAAQVPVLVEEDGSRFAESTAICEYLEEAYPDTPTLGDSIKERAEIRRIAGWFNNKFYYEVTKYILDEKVFKFLTGKGEPSCSVLSAGRENLTYHLEYITFLVSKHQWLAGQHISMADITAAAHLSVLDYLNEIPWDSYPTVKEWYALIKSRPSFQPLLKDHVSGFTPPAHYTDLDF